MCPETFLFLQHSTLLNPSTGFARAGPFTRETFCGHQGTLDSTGRAFHAGHLGNYVSTGRSPFSEVFFYCVCAAGDGQTKLESIPTTLRLGMRQGWAGGRSILSPGLELGAR